MISSTTKSDLSKGPELAHIGRNMAYVFSAVVLTLMLIVAIAGSLFYEKISNTNEKELQEIITRLMAHSINRISFSGKYHARLLVEQIAESQPRIAYILILDLKGKIIASSGELISSKVLPSNHLNLVQHVLNKKTPLFNDKNWNNISIKQVAMPYRSGYKNKVSGIILVGISMEETKNAKTKTHGALVILILILTFISLKVTRLLSRRLANPVISQAWQFKSIMDNAPIPICISDVNGYIRESSTTFKSLPGESAEMLISSLKSVFLKNTPKSHHLPEQVINDNSTFISTTFPVLLNDQNKPILACSIALDVSELKQVKTALIESEAKFRSYVESAPDGIFVANEKGIYVDVNLAACRITGYTYKELIGKALFSLIHPNDLNYAEKHFNQTKTEGHASGELRFITKGGDVRYWFVEAVKLSDNRLLGFAKDITEKKLMEEQLRQSEKMQAIGQLAGGIAHDFNNQLAGILGYTDLLREESKNHPQMLEYVENIILSTKRASDLTNQLLAFSRKGNFLNTAVDMHHIINEAVNLLQHSIDKKILIKQELHAKLTTVIGDPTQLQNVILNLALNARDAISSTGQITISTHLENDTDTLSDIDLHALDKKDLIKISVSDDGIGMDEDTLLHIFEPFFTTKEQGKGIGMGLAAVYGTIKNHKGTITVQSKLGVGTTMNIYLPLTSIKASQNKDVPPPKPPLPKSLKILLVEDEEIVRNLGERILKKLGHQAFTCKNSLEGIEFYKKHWQETDLVILDIIMPDMDGKETFQVMKEINPEIVALISSGYTIESKAQSILNDGAKGFLQKPFRIVELAQKINEITGPSENSL